jgi:ribosomal protein S19E (S16A)
VNLEMKSIEKQIEKSITTKRKGTLFLPDDFLSYGSSEAIRKALGRLEDKKIIIRVSQGIYVQPKTSKLIGPLTPSAEEVAEAIAKRDKIRTIPTGSYALNALGLSSQVPMKIVLLTDGSPREIKVGKRSIKFKRTTPKNLMAKGKISRLVIQALKEIGIGKIRIEEEHKILELLKKENVIDLKHDIALAPVWIQKLMKKALPDGQN